MMLLIQKPLSSASNIIGNVKHAGPHKCFSPAEAERILCRQALETWAASFDALFCHGG